MATSRESALTRFALNLDVRPNPVEGVAPDSIGPYEVLDSLIRTAGLIKIADKICNLRDILASPPADWTRARKREYFDWAKQMMDQVRGVSPVLKRKFVRVWEAGRTGRRMRPPA